MKEIVTPKLQRFAGLGLFFLPNNIPEGRTYLPSAEFVETRPAILGIRADAC